MLRTSMELGGNAPFVVFDDADLDKAVDGAMLAKFRNIGQACTAANRFIVQRSVADEFARRVTERVQGMKIGRGTEDGVTIGPLINEARRRRRRARSSDDAVAARRARADRRQGARRARARSTSRRCVTDVQPGSDILREEIFGPVLAIIPFDTEDDAVRIANDTEYGLVSYVFTESLARGQRMIERLETGMMGLNVGRRLQRGRARSAAGRCRASAARAAPRASTSTSRRSTRSPRTPSPDPRRAVPELTAPPRH